MRPRPQRAALFPYTTLFRSRPGAGRGSPVAAAGVAALRQRREPAAVTDVGSLSPAMAQYMAQKQRHHDALLVDRKSTRLNSSHSQISYAVCCLKKKKTRG